MAQDQPLKFQYFLSVSSLLPTVPSNRTERPAHRDARNRRFLRDVPGAEQRIGFIRGGGAEGRRQTMPQSGSALSPVINPGRRSGSRFSGGGGCVFIFVVELGVKCWLIGNLMGGFV